MQPRERLTAKEMQVAGLVWEGQTNREIARAIGTTEQVVKNYLRNTFDKLGRMEPTGAGHLCRPARRREMAGGNRYAAERRHVGDDCFLIGLRPPRWSRGLREEVRSN